MQKMKVGSKWELVCPPEIAYGGRAMGSDIPANSVLVFTMEMLSCQGVSAARSALFAPHDLRRCEEEEGYGGQGFGIVVIRRGLRAWIVRQLALRTPLFHSGIGPARRHNLRTQPMVPREGRHLRALLRERRRGEREEYRRLEPRERLEELRFQEARVGGALRRAFAKIGLHEGQ